MKKLHRLLLRPALMFWLFCVVRPLLPGQTIDAASFRAMSAAERLQVSQALEADDLDTATLRATLAQLCRVAQEEGDARSVFVLKLRQ
ncbi:MAG: hypothetical protein ACK4Q5_12360 [Saprospiraceae bacterium]